MPIDLGIHRDFGVGDAALHGDAAPDDAALDAAADLGADAGCTCAPTSVCDTASCATGTCVHAPVVDGTDCGGGSICVVGTCAVRGCGDGYREPGASPPREECDDGNTAGGDGCSATCTVTPVAVPGEALVTDYPTGGASPPLAADSSGAILLVWQVDIGSTTRVRARRYTASGAPIDTTPIDVGGTYPLGYFLDPGVAGLSDGWAVTWSDGTYIDYLLVARDGTVGAPFAASEGMVEVPSKPRIAALSGGFVIVWAVLGPAIATDPYDGIRGRTFDALGSATTAPFIVPASHAAREGSPALAVSAADPDEWLVAWTVSSPPGMSAPSTVRGRRFVGSTPLDVADIALAPDNTHDAAVAALTGHDYALAWVLNSSSEDVHARTVLGASPDYDVAADLPVATSSTVAERVPAIARLGTGYVVAWLEGSTGGPSTAANFAAVGGVVLGPEEATVRTSMTGYIVNHVALAPARGNGVWLSWSSRGGGRPGLPSEDAMLAYLGME